MTRWRIIFDYDNTIIHHDNCYELKLMTDFLGIEYDEQTRQELINYYVQMNHYFEHKRVSRTIFEDFTMEMLPLLKKHNISMARFNEAQIYKDKMQPMLMEGALEILEYLKGKNYFLCVLTNGFLYEQSSSMKAQGVYHYFDRIYAWDNFFCKPDVRAFARALAGTCPSENIMIGDSVENDIIPAKKLGIYTCGINMSSKAKAKPDISLNTLSELVCYL